MGHDFEWVTAPPLWNVAQADPGARARFREPAILRFDTDTFMEDTLALMEKGDPALADRVARPEAWDKPAAGWVATSDPSLSKTLRLYQPAHSRFYLTTASLVCRRVGLPVRKVDTAAGERTSVLLRRLVARDNRTLDPTDPETYTEQAWIGDRKAGVWQTLSGVVAKGEERLPAFPMNAAGDQGKKRQVWANMLPVASREIYEGARPANAAPTAPSGGGGDPDPLADLRDPRRATFAATVIQGLTTLLDSPAQPTPAAVMAAAEPYMRDSLTFILLDLVDFLAAQLSDVLDAVRAGSSAGLSSEKAAVFDALGASFSATSNWRTALLAADAHRPTILGTGTDTGAAPVSSTFSGDDVRNAAVNLIHGGLFQSAVFAALGDPQDIAPAAPGGPPVIGARAAETGEPEGGLYWIRFLYERPVCDRFHDPVVSNPSRPFRLGAFFDPDAPARPLVIRMPFDTSPKGLRRFPKGVAVLMSNKLRQQVERVRNQKLKDLDDGKVGDEPSWGLGMICSLSIPIITICAFLVLMIFLQLLNIVFWWMAFFKICLPIPVRNN
jgi:hypothetical protein